MALKMSSTLPTMMPIEFILKLPKVLDLACDDTCPVCLEKYAPTKPPAPGIVERFFSMVVPREPEPIDPDLERAVRLPCQHVIGLRCIKRWVSPVEGGQSTCPYCVQKLFKASQYPVSTHPLWTSILNILSQYGLTLDRNGLWCWEPTASTATLSAQDLLDASTLYPKLAALLDLHCPPSPLNSKEQAARKLAVQHFATERKMRHLQDAILYLQLQTLYVKDLPLIDPQIELEPTYPFFRLQKHQEDALVRHEEGLCPSLEKWRELRQLGVLPQGEWLE